MWRAARDAASALVVVRADQLVHVGLVRPVVDGLERSAAAITVVPAAPAAEDLPSGAYAGAFAVSGAAAGDVIVAIARGDTDTAIADSLRDAARIPHGDIARAPVATAADRKLAHRILYRTLIKPQDNAVTRYLYRPVSFALTRALVWTPLTPNQISYAVAALVAIGCWIASSASDRGVLIGTVVVLAASYLECCDGEVARVKLLSSRFGAWIDTIVDEMSTLGYMIAIGVHCERAFGPGAFGELPFDPWHAGIALGVVTYGGAMYCIYYNLIVGVGSANSQDYVGRFEVVPGGRPGSVRLRPVVAQPIAPRRELPGWLAAIATYLPYAVRRDFISWAALGFVVLHGAAVLFAGLTLGGIVTFAIVAIDHIQLRRLRRAIVRGGQILEPSS